MLIKLLTVAGPVVLVVVLGAALLSSCGNGSTTTTFNLEDGLVQFNPRAEAEATAISQKAVDDAARRELERQALLAQVQTEERAQPAKLAGKSTFYLLGLSGLGVGSLILCIGVAFVVVAWLGRKATTIYPKNGQYPLVTMRGFGWAVVHDASRQVGPTAVYRVPSALEVVGSWLKLAPPQADYPMPAVSEPALLAVASQSNAIGVTAAQSRWPKLPEFLAKSIRLDNTHLPSAPLELPEPQAPALAWPSRVPLRGLLAGQTPSLSRLALGVTVKDDGHVEPVTGDLGRMIHILVGGGSGWGKSVFLRALAYQLAASSEPCNIVLADLERLTFADFSKSSRLLYPIVDREQDLVAVLGELRNEIDRRKELLVGDGDIVSYNAHADVPLVPVVLMIDEASEYLRDGQVADGIKTLARRGRKYAVWIVLGGQSFSSKDLETASSLMFSTRCQFHAPVKTSAQTLVGDVEARSLECPGRALLSLPGQPVVKVQAPFVTHDDILAALEGRGPQKPMPATVGTRQEQDDGLDAKIRLMAGDGMSKTNICRQLFGTAGGTAWYRVSRVLEDVGASSSSSSAAVDGQNGPDLAEEEEEGR